MHHPLPPSELPVARGEIQLLAHAASAVGSSSSTGGGGSFTALLGLPTSQAIQLLLPPPAPALAPTFPSDKHLVDRAARISSFASPSPSLPPPLASADAKRKADPASKGKVAKKGKTAAGGEEKAAGDNGEEEKPAYVHVRARRGQATDNHSLAEWARREKINTRMELLKELVPDAARSASFSYHSSRFDTSILLSI